MKASCTLFEELKMLLSYKYIFMIQLAISMYHSQFLRFIYIYYCNECIVSKKLFCKNFVRPSKVNVQLPYLADSMLNWFFKLWQTACFKSLTFKTGVGFDRLNYSCYQMQNKATHFYSQIFIFCNLASFWAVDLLRLVNM